MLEENYQLIFRESVLVLTVSYLYLSYIFHSFTDISNKELPGCVQFGEHSENQSSVE